MAAVSAHDVARELRELLPSIGAAKLQKLLYYCQGWHVARNGEPLFTETLEAWVNGPVVAQQGAHLLAGERPSAQVIAAVAEVVGERDIDPPDDIHASAAFRRHLARVLTRRALTSAVARAQG